jgi:hypothetical protein
LQIHAVDMPIGLAQDVFAQMMADEAVDPENQYILQALLLNLIGATHQASASG